MIKVAYYKINDDILGFSCKGHAGYAEYGSDIVCAAVSILVINTINSIQNFTKDSFEYSEDEAKGEIVFYSKDIPSHDSQLLLNSLFLGLKGIQDEYGTRYIQIKKSDKKIC